MEQLGIIRRSSSPWSSSLYLVSKSPGGWRSCGDYRRPNNATTPDRYPVPHIQDCTARLAGSRLFSKVDLVWGYQIPVAPITPFGLFEYLRMPFGLKNTAQAFQRLVDVVCQDLSFTFVYLDDVSVFSQSEEQHKSHLRLLFQQLSRNRLLLNPKKCSFGQSELDLLGHHVTASGVIPHRERMQAIRDFPRPTTKKELQQYTVMMNFYHRFVSHLADLMRPIYLTISSKDRSLSWISDLDQAFASSKETLANLTLLTLQLH